MKNLKKVPTFKGRFLGIAVLAIVQLVIGAIHVIFGFTMLSGTFYVAFSTEPLIYSIYTFAYGSLTLLFTYLVWEGERLGWIGTVAVSLFIIFADALTALDLFTVLGIPKFAAVGEIPFSILILAYVLQGHVRSKYNI